jgi:hypothetical protein
MAQVKVKTEVVFRKGEEDPLVLMKISLLPHGSGNRNLARRVGKAFQTDERFKDHVTRVKVGSSSVWVYFRASFEMMWTVWNIQHAPKDVPGQMALPGMELAS